MMFYDLPAFAKAFATSLITFTGIHYILSEIIPKDDKRKHWNRVNLSTSFIHCTMSTIMCIYWFVGMLFPSKTKITKFSFLKSHFSVYENPKMCTTEMISSFTPLAYSLVSFEIGLNIISSSFCKQTFSSNCLGYFFFDAIDMLRKSSGQPTYAVLLHHVIVSILSIESLLLHRFP